MSYTALYRVWRPARWEDVVNQKPVVRILQNALVENKVSHAYLFSGPRGTGKTTVARLLAKAVNCPRRQDAEPCNECDTCTAIAQGTSVDVIEIDAASNRGIDEIRSLRESVRYLPVMGRYKVYIIDEVHMLTPEAFNALLKTLEEPPEHVIFILATTAAHKIPVTIASRCQRLEFRRLSIGDIEGQLEKILALSGIQWEQGGLRLIARAALGSMRDALSILDLCLTYGEGKVLEQDVRDVLGETAAEVMVRLFGALSREDLKGVMDVTREVSERGKDMGEFCQELGTFARDLLFLGDGGSGTDLGRTEDEIAEMLQLSAGLPRDLLIKVLETTSNAIAQMRNTDNQRLVVDMALLGLFGSASANTDDVVQQQPYAQKKSRTVEKRGADEAPSVSSPPASSLVDSSEPTSSQALPSDTVESQADSDMSNVKDAAFERDYIGARDLSTPDGVLQAVNEVWPSLLDELQKKRKIQARAYLLPARPSRIVDGNRLVLAYPEGYATHMEQILSDNHKRVVQEYLEKLLDLKLDLSVEVDRPDANAGSGAGGNGDDLHPLVEAAINILEGKIIT